MSTVIIRTTAGSTHDHAVRMGNAQPSKIAKIVCYKHQAITDIAVIKALTSIPTSDESHVVSDFAQISLSNTASQFLAVLGADVVAQINAVSLHLENGVIWGYAPYFLSTGGLEKTNEFIAELEIVTAEMDDSDTLTIRQELFDLREMRERLLESFTSDANEALTLLIQTEVEKYLCAGIQAPALGQDPDCNQEPA